MDTTDLLKKVEAVEVVIAALVVNEITRSDWTQHPAFTMDQDMGNAEPLVNPDARATRWGEGTAQVGVEPAVHTRPACP